MPSSPASERGAAGALLLLGLLLLPSAPRAEAAVDLALVLAVDASGSVDQGEFALQMSGIAAAFRDPEVVAAVRSGPRGRIAVTLALWSEPNLPKDSLSWHLVDGAESAERFARAVERQPRSVRAGGTGIGKGVMYALGLLRFSGLDAARRVVDLSGDGRETAPRDYTVPVAQARHAAQRLGITVNALAILSDEPDLEAYYRREVIAGPGAFVVRAGGFDDFARAMRAKLVREIDHRPQLSAWPEAWPRRPERPRPGPGSSFSRP